MATARLVPSVTYLSSTNLTIASENNMFTNTDSTTSGTVTNTRSGTSSYYLYLRGFNFDDVPTNAIVSSISIKIKAKHSGGNTGTIGGYNGTTSVSSAGTTTALGTTESVKTFTNTTINWSTLKGYGADFGIRINCRRSNRNTQSVITVYGAEIEVTYTAETVHVTGVTLNKNTTSIEVGETETLTVTVAPNNASDKSVSWSSSNTSVATVSNGIVTGVSAGTARITVTTTDGSYTAYCDVTVTQPVLTSYKLATSMEVGKSYIIANGNSGSVYMLTDESGGSRTLVGLAATVSNNIIQLTAAQASRVLFECVRYTNGNDVTITVRKNNKYLYTNNANGLTMQSTNSLDRFWHYYENKFWQFKSTSSNGYTDTSSEYKYYLTWNNGNATDNHVTSPSIQDSNIPLTYIYEEYTEPSASLFVKMNGSWVEAAEVYKKVNGSWVLQTDLSNVFDATKNYVKG